MKKQLNPRKQAKQSRSQDMMTSILDAATRILEQLGYERTTTNKIADKAGISIGSFYQYFPNKDALFAKVIESQITLRTHELEQIIQNHLKSPQKVVINLIVTYLLDHFYLNARLAKFLFLQLNQLNKVELQLSIRHKFAGIIADWLHTQHHIPQQVALNKSAVITHAVMGVIYTNLLSNEMALERKVIQLELEKLILSYLFTP